MSSRTVGEIIKGQELLTASASTPVSEVARSMRGRRVGAVLVVEDGKLAGIFTERDALFRVVAEKRDAATTTVGQVMTANPTAISPRDPFPMALHLMHEGQFRHVPVVEDGKPVGIVSSRDAMGPELEDFMYSLILRGQANDVLA
ncbi:MAG: CBS domain-containing protein [Gammaproteobacteria bacterium]|nr:CBS domain-containing protein [Gammaproteobacteria bacterium]